MRYSTKITPKQDADYAAAEESGDMDTAQHEEDPITVPKSRGQRLTEAFAVLGSLGSGRVGTLAGDAAAAGAEAYRLAEQAAAKGDEAGYRTALAVLNFFLFCGGELLRMLPRRPSAKTVNFRQESQRIRREQRDQLYRHKCAVCGRTDVTNPELEFRYCSRCAGYHCFCQDHINNHIHFTE